MEINMGKCGGFSDLLICAFYNHSVFWCTVLNKYRRLNLVPLQELEKVTHSQEIVLKKAKYFKVRKDKEFLLVYWTHSAAGC